MPLRDNRPGRRATIGAGNTPLRPEFALRPEANNTSPTTPAEATHDIGASGEPAGDARSGDGPAIDAATRDVRDAGAASTETPLKDEAVYSFDLSRTTSDAVEPVNRNATNDGREAPESDCSLADESEAPVHSRAVVDALQRRSLLEPSAVLFAIARPFYGLRSALLRLVYRSEAPPRVAASDTMAASFASEVASLIGPTSIQSAQPAERPDDSPTPGGTAKTAVAIESRAGSAMPLSSRLEGATLERRMTFIAPSDEPLEHDSLVHCELREQEGAAPEIDGNKSEAADRTDGFGGISRKLHTLNADAGRAGEAEIGSASRIDAASEASVASDVAPYALAEHNIVVAALPLRRERAVPITRLPLRPQGFEITWPAQLPESERGGSLSRTERHQLLERFVRNPGSVSGDTIARAYREEEGMGRTIALRVLLRNFPQAGRSSFIEALRVGSDEERAVAVDGLTAVGARDELTPAFSDRIDAIAAKAALSYVGTFERADYRKQLSNFVDETQIDAILKMLAGIVE